MGGLPNGLLIAVPFILYALVVYGPKVLARKHKILGEPYKK